MPGGRKGRSMVTIKNTQHKFSRQTLLIKVDNGDEEVDSVGTSILKTIRKASNRDSRLRGRLGLRAVKLLEQISNRDSRLRGRLELKGS